MKNSVLVLISVFVFFCAPISGYPKVKRPAGTGMLKISDFSIVNAGPSSAFTRQAASELKKYLDLCSAGNIPVTTTLASTPGNEFIIMEPGLIKNELLNTVTQTLKTGGFSILRSGKQIYIIGSKDAVLYGVYEFLERFMNCRQYAPGVIVTPAHSRFTMKQNYKLVSNPAFIFRYNYSFDAMHDKNYRNWLHLTDEHEWGLFVHTYSSLVPPELYFKQHPDYFALYKGSRTGSQLNPSSLGVEGIIGHKLDSLIRDAPFFKYWSVSQNDGDVYCQCEDCQKINSAEGSPQAANLLLVNKLAVKFPDRIISTLAYRFSQKPPLTIRPASNVNIMLCDIDCDRSMPIGLAGSASGFKTDLDRWASISNNIMIWDYTTQFTHYIAPFPNLFTLQPNLKYFKDKGIKMVMEQGNSDCPGEFSELRSYLLSKLMWNPDLNFNALLNDFLKGYYGKAAPYIYKYIIDLHQGLKVSGLKLGIYDNPVIAAGSYLSPEKLETYQHLFDQAEAAVKSDPSVLKRVMECRLPVEYAFLTNASHRNTLSNGVFTRNASGKFKINDGLRERVDLFVKRCNAAGIRKLRENGESPDQYLKFWKDNVFINEQN